jgi:hypothetical protein
VTGTATDLPPGEVAGTSARPRRRVTVGRVLLAISLLGIVAMWVYAIFFAPSVSPEMIPDRAWVARSETTCKAHRTLIYALPHARTFKDVTPKSEALRQRADVADQATNALREQLKALKADVPADAVSATLVNRWLAEWDVYISDRDAHVAQFRGGIDPPFAQTANETGAPGPIRMDQFARTNKMVSCQVPLDLG